MEINCNLIGLWRIQENNSNSNFDVDADRNAGFILKCYVMMPHGAHASFKILKLVYRIVFGDMFSNVNIHLFSTFPSFYSPGVHSVPFFVSSCFLTFPFWSSPTSFFQFPSLSCFPAHRFTNINHSISISPQGKSPSQLFTSSGINAECQRRMGVSELPRMDSQVTGWE